MQDLMVLCLTQRIFGPVVTIFLSLSLFLACLISAQRNRLIVISTCEPFIPFKNIIGIYSIKTLF